MAPLFRTLEYRGVANVVAETAWLRNLLRELHSPLSTATLVYCDNISAVYMSANPVQHQRTKHIEIDIHFVRDMVTAGQVCPILAYIILKSPSFCKFISEEGEKIADSIDGEDDFINSGLSSSTTTITQGATITQAEKRKYAAKGRYGEYHDQPMTGFLRYYSVNASHGKVVKKDDQMDVVTAECMRHLL
ncbi:ribonuclease H-like domain-containing protein [Tanacetum coccineum]